MSGKRPTILPPSPPEPPQDWETCLDLGLLLHLYPGNKRVLIRADVLDITETDRGTCRVRTVENKFDRSQIMVYDYEVTDTFEEIIKRLQRSFDRLNELEGS